MHAARLTVAAIHGWRGAEISAIDLGAAMMSGQRAPTLSARERLFVALDVPDGAKARSLIERLGPAVTSYKLGLELIAAVGFDLARELKAKGCSVFLDMKFLDIPNTVESATANVARLGIDFLTIHGQDRKTLDAAVRGRGTSALKLLAVTVLTSVDARDLAEQGIVGKEPSDVVLQRAAMAKAAGFDGVVASGQEAAAIRREVGPGFLIVTPGVRLAGGASDDQARVMTPAAALASGATHLVVGRPITAVPDPVAAARAFLAEMA
jgi:orotidine-5'-phosphate decarboxylase